MNLPSFFECNQFDIISSFQLGFREHYYNMKNQGNTRHLYYYELIFHQPNFEAVLNSVVYNLLFVFSYIVFIEVNSIKGIGDTIEFPAAPSLKM